MESGSIPSLMLSLVSSQLLYYLDVITHLQCLYCPSPSPSPFPLPSPPFLSYSDSSSSRSFCSLQLLVYYYQIYDLCYLYCVFLLIFLSLHTKLYLISFTYCRFIFSLINSNHNSKTITFVVLYLFAAKMILPPSSSSSPSPQFLLVTPLA